MDENCRVINTEIAREIYVDACNKNNVKPLSKIKFFEKLLTGVSASLSTACYRSIPSIVNFPVDDKREIWCLIVPCQDGSIMTVFGPENIIREKLDVILKHTEGDNNDISSVQQF